LRILGRVRPSPFYLFIGAISLPVAYGLYRLRAEGVENVPEDGGFVLAANHASNFDPWPLGLPLWPRRYLRFMAKSELFSTPLGPVIKAGGAFPVRRGEGDRDAMEKAIGLVREGQAVVMFPEGTRQKKGLRKKHTARPHSGAARIALEAGVPLVPAAIAGTDRLSRLKRLRVRYGKPIPLDDLRDKEVSAGARAATERLMTQIEHLGEGL
jgi:1-acyl-sn-glycerol-3-phosphate acyltransferase